MQLSHLNLGTKPCIIQIYIKGRIQDDIINTFWRNEKKMKWQRATEESEVNNTDQKDSNAVTNTFV